MTDVRITTTDGVRVTVQEGGPGVVGSDGASAYELAVANGFVGTEAEWLASLKGEAGEGGAVDSVNGQTGVVTLGAADVGARPNTYVPAWSEVTGKPATFPSDAHTHDDRYYTETEVDTQFAANATADRARANHTGTQTSATISDFTEAVQDAVSALLAAGTAISLSYDDVGNSLTITGSGGLDAEAVRDAIGVALIGSGLISVMVNDAADTITISTTATANSTDAQLRDRSTHTGTQAAATITGLATVATSGAYADLSGKPAIPDSPDDIGAAAATHTHAQADITGLSTTLAGKADASALTAHTSDTANPHAVTKAQVGLGNVDNTSDANKPVSTAQQTALDAKADKTRSINAQTGTAYTLVLADAGKFLTMTNAAASTLTVPPNSSVAFPVGATIEGAQLGAGQVTITAGSGVTVNATPGLKVAAQYGTFGLLKVATDSWLAYGRLSA